MTNEDIVLSIGTLKEYTSGMIKRCQDAVTLSVDSMVNKNLEQAEKIMESDDDIDLLREYIRDRSIELMASKHPMTKDLKYICVLSDISTELERIGDYAVNICKETLAIGEDEYIKELIDIQCQYGISIDALMYKAKELNIITESRFKTYFIKKNRVPDFKKLVELNRFQEECSSRFERLVYRALASEIISFSKASVLIKEPVHKLKESLNLV